MEIETPGERGKKMKQFMEKETLVLGRWYPLRAMATAMFVGTVAAVVGTIAAVHLAVH